MSSQWRHLLSPILRRFRTASNSKKEAIEDEGDLENPQDDLENPKEHNDLGEQKEKQNSSVVKQPPTWRRQSANEAAVTEACEAIEAVQASPGRHLMIINCFCLFVARAKTI